MARRRAGLFVWASRQATGSVPAKARTAALRFLARRLVTLPSTSGCFAPNVRLPIAFAGNPYMDVDLFDATDNLVILLDDTSSLADPDTYRRSRRQDNLLQTAGHRVLRYLASDVPAHLPAILDDICRLVIPSETPPNSHPQQ